MRQTSTNITLQASFMTHLVLVVVVGLPFSFCCFAINLISLFQSTYDITKMPCSQFSQKVLRKVSPQTCFLLKSLYNSCVIAIDCNKVAQHSRHFTAIWQPRKPYLISIPCNQPRYSYICAKTHVLIFLFHLPAEKLESYGKLGNCNTSQQIQMLVLTCCPKPPERCSNDGRSTANCYRYTVHGTCFIIFSSGPKKRSCLGASTCSISASGFEPEPKALNIKR